jgi:hypothetical protein
MSEDTITHEQATHIAAEWAAVSDESVNTHIDVRQIPDGFLVELVVYYGSGPFEPVGTAAALIDNRGQLRELRAA